MPPSPQPKPNDDAYLALSSNGTWVNNADTKIGFLATALSVLTVAAVKQRPRVEALLDAGVHSRGVLSLVLLAVCAVFLVVAGAWLFTALRRYGGARTRGPGPRSQVVVGCRRG